MTKRDARNCIYTELGNVLSRTDFQLKRSEEGFVRRIRGGRQRIGVALYAYNRRFEFSIVISIRLDAVQNISNMFSGAPPEYHSETGTAIVQIEYFADVPTLFHVTNEEEIRNAVAQLAPIVREKIVPFLDEHQDVASLDRALNRGAKSVDTSHHPYRGMYGIVVAKLAGNPDFDAIVERYLAEMSSMPAQDRDKFIRLVEYLKTHVGPIKECEQIQP
jgi:hypothetical protein